MMIHLTTLGGLRIRRGGHDLDHLLRQRSRTALFLYLAVEGSATRESLATVFWPESNAENARHALRQSLYHLRGELGSDWLEQRAQELRTGPAVRTDVHDFAATLEAGDPESAARLYTGPFLDGVHLVDLQSWESWVDARRLEYARLFRQVCRDWLDARLEAGDLPGAVEAARHWVGPDPYDDEAQHRLIDVLTLAGERSEAIRQFELYARLLEADGLRPLEETVALVERARSEPLASPIGGGGWNPVEDAEAARPGRLAFEEVSSQGRRWPGRAAALTAVAVGAFLLVVAALALAFGRSGTAPGAAHGDIAVLPFAVRGAGDADYLGAGIVTLLGTALDGPTIRPVDTRAVLAVAAESATPAPDLDTARRLAVRLGAGLFVLGDIVQVGDGLQVEAAVYRTDGSAVPVARAALTGDTERVFELVDNLAARLLAGLGAAPGDRLTRTAAATTRSLAAFKAYLEGEAEVRAGRFERAVEAYLRAIAQDSTFAIAHYRLALARDFAALDGFEDAARAAARHAERLAPRDRALLEALQAYHAGDALGAERRYRAILARYPDDLDAWFQLAEVQFHLGPLHGRPSDESESAWRTVLSYEPRNLWALVHLARIAAKDGRYGTIDTLLARFGPEERHTDRRLVQLEILRAVAARDTATAIDLARQVRGWEDAAAYQLAAYLTAFTHAPAAARPVVRTLVEPRRGAGMVADLHWFSALLSLANGQLRAARQDMAEAHAANAAVASSWHRQTFEMLTDWWAAALPVPWPDSMIDRVRREGAARTILPLEPDRGFEQDRGFGDQIWFALARDALIEPGRLEAVRQYAVGLLSLRLGDRAGAVAALDALVRLTQSHEASWFVRDFERGLRAHLALHDGRPEEGLEILEGLELAAISVGVANITPFVARAHDRYVRGALLEALGRDAEALPWFASLAGLSVAESPFRAPAHLRQAQIHERLGNEAEAVRHYARVLELWGSGDEEVLATLDEVRRRAIARR
jgi:DNA-binding SARP family transcriptional activator